MELNVFIQEITILYAKRYTLNAKNGLSLFEFIIALIIISIFAGVFSIFIHKAAIHAREVALQAELYNLRMSLDLYKELKGGYPQDLRTLIQAEHRLNTGNDVLFGPKFLSTVGLDNEGYPIDPFGNKFYYDSIRGAVCSKTKAYEQW